MDGRKHTDVQTEVYLEEITDRVIEAEVCTQTDAFLDRPPTPLFVPAKTGMDAATQIEEGDVSARHVIMIGYLVCACVCVCIHTCVLNVWLVCGALVWLFACAVTAFIQAVRACSAHWCHWCRRTYMCTYQ